jgi:hypothetical protein
MKTNSKICTAFFCILFTITLFSEDFFYQVEEKERADASSGLSFICISDIAFASYTVGDKIFIVVEFDAEEEKRSHRSWIWNPFGQHYVEGDDKETTFSILIKEKDSSFGDLWIWRAALSDPVGIAEDYYTFVCHEKTQRPKITVVQRDSGQRGWKSKYFDEFAGQKLPRFQHGKASGSAADVAASGKWSDKRWRLLISRKLDTGHSDDLPLAKEKIYTLLLDKNFPPFQNYETAPAVNLKLVSQAENPK